MPKHTRLHCVALMRICLCGSLVAPLHDLEARNYLPERETPVPPDEQIPTVDFFRPPLFTNPDLNPSGTHFAALARNEKVESILNIYDIESGKQQSSYTGIHSFAWIDDKHLHLNDEGNGVIDVNRPRRRLLVTEVLRSGTRGLMRDSGFLWSWPIEDRPIGSHNSRNLRVWHSLEDGIPVFCVTLELDGRRHLYRRVGSKWIECAVDMDEVTPLALGDVPGEMIVIGPAAKGSPRALQRLDTVTGQLGEVLYRDAEYDCRPDVWLDRATRVVVGVSVPGLMRKRVWLTDRMKEVQEWIDQQFPGKIARIVSADIAMEKFGIEIESDREPVSFLILDRQKKDLSNIKQTQPWLDVARMVPMQMLQYKARDGALIDGLLVLPPGISKENPAPVIVAMHSRMLQDGHEWGMDEGAQFFASRGFAVFLPNFRGTPGYDSRFDPADRFDFQKMSDDVVDGVRAIIESGLIDPRRVVAMGGGFGAYLAMCGAVDEPELYRCAIISDGIFDWERLFRKKDSLTKLEDRWLERRLRELNQTPPSPWKRRDRIKIPILMTRDRRIDKTYETQILEFHRALKKQVPCELFGDMNIVTDRDQFIELLERFDRIEAFLGRYCAPN